MAKRDHDPILTGQWPSTRVPGLVILCLLCAVVLVYLYFLRPAEALLGPPLPKNTYVDAFKEAPKPLPPSTPAPVPQTDNATASAVVTPPQPASSAVDSEMPEEGTTPAKTPVPPATHPTVTPTSPVAPAHPAVAPAHPAHPAVHPMPPHTLPPHVTAPDAPAAGHSVLSPGHHPHE